MLFNVTSVQANLSDVHPPSVDEIQFILHFFCTDGASASALP